MTTIQEERAQRRRDAQEVGSLAIPIGLLILSMIFGMGALALLCFGVWPGVILLLGAAAMSTYAVKRIKHYDLATKTEVP